MNSKELFFTPGNVFFTRRFSVIPSGLLYITHIRVVRNKLGVNLIFIEGDSLGEEKEAVTLSLGYEQARELMKALKEVLEHE